MPEEKRPNCFKCRYFITTWDAQLPRGCEAFNFKTASIPAQVVFENSGHECEAFEPKDHALRKKQAKADKYKDIVNIKQKEKD